MATFFLIATVEILNIAMFYLEYTTYFCRLASVCRPIIRIYFKTYMSKVNINTTKRWNSVELSHRR